MVFVAYGTARGGMFALLFLLGFFPVEAQSAPAALLEYDKTPETVLIRFTEVLGEIAEADSGPQIQIHGDGLVVVSFPKYMKRAGSYTMVLDPGELDALLTSLLEKGLADFDEAAIAKQKHSAEVEKQKRSAIPTLFFSSDPSRISLELQVERYVSADGKATARDIEQKISWSGLRDDTLRHGDIDALKNLDAATAELRTLMQSPKLVRVD